MTTSVVGVGDAALSVGNADGDILHHALVLMVEDVAVQDELADIALVPRPDDDLANAGRGVGQPRRRGDQALDPERILPDALQTGILRIDAARIGIVHST